MYVSVASAAKATWKPQKALRRHGSEKSETHFPAHAVRLRYHRRVEETIAIVGDRWWPQAAKHDGGGIGQTLLCHVWNQRTVMSAQLLEASL